MAFRWWRRCIATHLARRNAALHCTALHTATRANDWAAYWNQIRVQMKRLTDELKWSRHHFSCGHKNDFLVIKIEHVCAVRGDLWRSAYAQQARQGVFFFFFLHFIIFILDDLQLKRRRLGHLLHSACGAASWHFHQQQQGFIVVLMRGHSELRQLETPNLWTKMRF